MEPLRLEVSRRDDAVVVAIAGELDDTTAERLRDFQVVEVTAGCTTLVVDLAHLEFMDSSGIGSLVNLRNRALAAGVTMRVEAAPDHIRHTFAVAGLVELFGLARRP